MATIDHLMEFVAGQLADVEAGWSVGTFGAIAEFTRDAGEPAELRRDYDKISIVTGRGGLCIAPLPELRLIASESLTAEAWSHRVTFCLPQQSCAMNRHMVLTEVGPDVDAIRPQDRGDVLFDLGLSTLQVDACIRTADGDVVTALRSRAGQSMFAAGNDAMQIIMAANPHRVFLSRIGRAEVYQPIPPTGGTSPDGPHTHVLPKLLAHGRTHAATEPLPEGWIPCAHLYPAHPLRDQLGRKRAFQQGCYTAFQVLFERYGDPELVAFKRRIIDAVVSGREPSTIAVANERFARATLRVALRQLQMLEQSSAAVAAWISVWDRFGPSDAEDPMEALH